MGLEELNRGEPQLALERFESAARRDNRDRALSDDLLAGLTAVHVGDVARAMPHLEAVVTSDAGLPDALLLKYAPELAFEVSITPEVSALIPAGSMAAALALIECYQDVGRHEEAVGVLQQLVDMDVDPALTLSLCELYAEVGDWDEVAALGERSPTRTTSASRSCSTGRRPASPRRGRGVRSRPTTSALVEPAVGRTPDGGAVSGEGAPSCGSAGRPRPGRTSPASSTTTGSASPPGPAAGRPPARGAPQNTRIGISAGASSREVSSSSSLTRVIETPAMSREVQYSPT